MHLYDIVLASPIANLDQKPSSPLKLLSISIICLYFYLGELLWYVLFALQFKERKEKLTVHAHSYRAWQKLPLSCTMYKAFTKSSLHPVNEDECLLGKKGLAVINFPKIIRVRHATWTLGLLMAALEWTEEG